jgi:tetratricopeptide (TPR) repeat protein
MDGTCRGGFTILLSVSCLLTASSLPSAAFDPRDQNPPPTALALLDEYDQGYHDEALLAIRQLVDPAIVARSTGPTGRFRQLGRDMGELVATWVGAAGPHRRNDRARTSSTLMLEAASLGLDFNVRLESCLDWLNASLRLRKLHPAAEFDRLWYLAALAVIAGTARPELIQQFVDATKVTDLEQPHRVLALAIAEELRLPDRRLSLQEASITKSGSSDSTLTTRTAPTRAPKPLPSLKSSGESDHLRTARESFDRARALEPVRAEATLRSGRLLARLREDGRALALLSEVPQLTRDGALVYLSHLFRGEILERLERTNEAVDAYRAAVVTAPNGRTARIMLAPLLFRLGAQQEAADVADSAISLPLAEDPWVRYMHGDRRLWNQRIADVRAALRGSGGRR